MNFLDFFKVKEGRPVEDEIRDQALHIFYAGVLWFVAFYPASPFFAGLLSFAFGYVRELEQHKWKWREVGKQDLFFWGIGSASLTIGAYVVQFFNT